MSIVKYLLYFLLLVSTSTSAVDYRTKIDLPTDAKCASGDPEVLIIDKQSDWKQINDVGKSIFCVEPGQYMGDIDITQSGSAGSERYIRLYDTNETQKIHPVHAAEADRAKLSGRLRFRYGVHHWIVDRITVNSTSTTPVWLFEPINPDPSDIILNRVLIEGHQGTGGVQIQGDGHVLQDSVIRNSAVTTNDDNCISFNGFGDGVRIVGNELYDCAGDAIIVEPGEDPTNAVISQNEMYITPAKYTDCAGSLDPNGNCLCAENAMDFKMAGSGIFPFSSSDRLLVTDNVFWGYNRNDDSACVTGAGSIGIAMVIHGGRAGNDSQAGQGLRFTNNVITSGPNNIESIGTIGANSVNRHYSFINNLYYDLDFALSLPSAKTDKHEFYYNTFIGAGKNIFFGVAGNFNQYLCNVFMNVQDNGILSLGSNEEFDYNAYYNFDNTDIDNATNISFTHDSESENEMYCWTKNHITDPTAECVPLAVTVPTSPHSSICNAPTETANRGNDDVTQLTRVQAGFIPPPLELTIFPEHSLVPLEYNFVAPVKGTYQFWFKVTTADTDSNALSYTVDDKGGQIVKFTYPAITSWNKGAVSMKLDAGMHTLNVVKRGVGIVLDEVFITNNPTFASP